MDDLIEVQPPASVLKDCQFLREHFPYRIVWAGYNPATDEWVTGASTTMHKINNRLRSGWRVYQA